MSAPEISYRRPLARTRGGTRPHSRGDLFHLYARAWILRNRARLRRRTRDVYEFTISRYLAPLDLIRLRNLTRSHVQTLIVDRMLAAGLSVSTVKSALVLLSAILTEAVNDEILTRNVATGLRRRLKAQPVRPATVYTPDQVTTFMATAERLKPELAPLFGLCAGAGLRVGEARAICGEDIDLPGRRLRVERSIRETSQVGPTKSGRVRTVELPTSCLRLLERFAGHQGWCFRGREPGSVISYTTVRAAMREICTAAGIPMGSPHALRHAAASTLAARGVPLLYIQRALGHADIKTTMLYADHLPLPRPSVLDDL